MPTEVIIGKLISEKSLNKTELKLVILSAAVLKGCKQSNMLCLTDKELEEMRSYIEKSYLSYEVLYNNNNKNLILIYRKKELEQHLSLPDIKTFLKSFGYEGEGLKDFLPELKRRLDFTRKNEGDFPHEIGIFLGYPLCDIKGFLENSGKDFLYSGHWKVYSNLEETINKFIEIDLARETAVEEWFAGRRFHEIAC